MNGDQAIERGVEWLTELLRLSGLSVSVSAQANQIKEFGGSDQSPDRLIQDGWWLTIDHADLSPEQIEGLIGDKGAVLDAMQYLSNATLNLQRPADQQQAYTIEIANYRANRQAELQAIAEEAAHQVRETGSDYELPSLSSAERRWIHTYLQPCADLATESRGREPDRRLVIRHQSLEEEQ